MLIGHGVDLVELSEIERHFDSAGWLRRCFSDEEVSNFPDGPNRAAHIAGRFAAKEAVLKALGTGYGGEIAFTDITISRKSGSPPEVTLSEGSLDMARTLGITRWLISISHSDHFAVASAIAEST